MTRVGKIARLPQHLRTQLNERLADGELGCTLVPWLNEQREVQEVVAVHFGGRPITEQNLSEWKNGGYEEWMRHQEARAVAQSYLAESEELDDEVGEGSLVDRTSTIAALTLLQLLREAQAGKGPGRYKMVLEIIRELQRLRRGDHQMARVQIQEARWESEQDAADEAEEKEMRRKTKFLQDYVGLTAREWLHEYEDGLAKGTLNPQRAAFIRGYFYKNAAMLRTCGVPDLPPESAPTDQSKSDQIQPNPTRASEANQSADGRDAGGRDRGGAGRRTGDGRAEGGRQSRSGVPPLASDPRRDAASHRKIGHQPD